MNIKLPYVQHFRVNGRDYTYYRRDNRRIRIIAEPPGSPDWMKAYQRIHDSWQEPDKLPEPFGTLKWLVQEYRKSPRWKQLKQASRASYERYLVELTDRYGDQSWLQLDRPTVIRIRDRHQDSGRRANYYIQLLSILGEVAIDLGMRGDNPARGVKKLASGPGWRAWEPDELLWFEGAAASPACRLAYFIGLYTGQRIGDVLSMTWNALDRERHRIAVVQEKTGAHVTIPIHPTLAEELATAKRTGLYIVGTGRGGRYTMAGFRTLWRREVLECGLNGVQFHGLRRNAASALAEAGCTDEEIMAITGHRTRAMVGLYTRHARQILLAQEAMRKLANRGS
ncbi:MAG: tyrosine-type recombinase/integrase [Oceanibaculum nanhaiense]|jgi:integrase|uniref:tyrosine-type recombinase/integrase n=1 Tax=Oceanibaculum nanhaiense TaxID=1909734 RepID=UPI0032EBC7A5